MQEISNKAYLWSHSQIGASHIRKEKPNQDSVGTLSLANDTVHILAVSDGHGSERYCRSDKGSQLAVEAAQEVCKQFFSSLPTLSDIKTRLDMVARKILHTWREDVKSHADKYPFNALELDLLKNPNDVKIAYGATLVIAILTPKYAVYLQLGDGDIVVIDHEQNITAPIEPDQDVVGVETHSLCEKDAERYWRIRTQSYEQLPQLVVLSTDGYANSFANHTSFLDMLTQLYQKIRQHGLGAILDILPAWLKDTTEQGSGDDISVALFCRESFSPSVAIDTATTPQHQPHVIDIDKAADIAELTLTQKGQVILILGKSLVQDLHRSLHNLRKSF